MKHIYLSIIASMMVATAPVNATSWYKPNWKNLSRFTTFSCPILLKNLHAPWNFRDMSSKEQALWGGVSALLVVTAAIGGWYWWSWRLKTAKNNQAKQQNTTFNDDTQEQAQRLLHGPDLSGLGFTDGTYLKKATHFQDSTGNGYIMEIRGEYDALTIYKKREENSRFKLWHKNPDNPVDIPSQMALHLWKLCEEHVTATKVETRIEPEDKHSSAMEQANITQVTSYKNKQGELRYKLEFANETIITTGYKGKTQQYEAVQQSDEDSLFDIRLPADKAQYWHDEATAWLEKNKATNDSVTVSKEPEVKEAHEITLSYGQDAITHLSYHVCSHIEKPNSQGIWESRDGTEMEEYSMRLSKGAHIGLSRPRNASSPQAIRLREASHPLHTTPNLTVPDRLQLWNAAERLWKNQNGKLEETVKLEAPTPNESQPDPKPAIKTDLDAQCKAKVLNERENETLSPNISPPPIIAFFLRNGLELKFKKASYRKASIQQPSTDEMIMVFTRNATDLTVCLTKNTSSKIHTYTISSDDETTHQCLKDINEEEASALWNAAEIWLQKNKSSTS